MRTLREGDSLTVTRLDRIGHSLKELLAIHEQLDRRGVSLQVIDQAIDTSTPMGRMVFGLVATIAEYEASLIAERTRIAMQSRPPGKRGGRKKVLSRTMVEQAVAMRAGGAMTMPQIARAVGVSESSVRRALNETKTD